MANPAVVSLRQRHNVLAGRLGADHPRVRQARRELELAKAEHRVRDALDNAPPLDPLTLERIRGYLARAEMDARRYAEAGR